MTAVALLHRLRSTLRGAALLMMKLAGRLLSMACVGVTSDLSESLLQTDHQLNPHSRSVSFLRREWNKPRTRPLQLHPALRIRSSTNSFPNLLLGSTTKYLAALAL